MRIVTSQTIAFNISTILLLPFECPPVFEKLETKSVRFPWFYLIFVQIAVVPFLAKLVLGKHLNDLHVERFLLELRHENIVVAGILNNPFGLFKFKLAFCHKIKGCKLSPQRKTYLILCQIFCTCSFVLFYLPTLLFVLGLEFSDLLTLIFLTDLSSKFSVMCILLPRMTLQRITCSFI